MYYTKKQASEFLTNEMGKPISDKSLSKFITKGEGPVYQKFGPRVVYTNQALIYWANSRLSKPIGNKEK